MLLLLIIASLVGTHFAEGLECYSCTSGTSVQDTQYSEFCEDGPTPEKLPRELIQNCTSSSSNSILVSAATGYTMDKQEVANMESVPYRCAIWTDRNKQFGRGCIAVIGDENASKYNESCFPAPVGVVQTDVCPCDGANCNGPKRTNVQSVSQSPFSPSSVSRSSVSQSPVSPSSVSQSPVSPSSVSQSFAPTMFICVLVVMTTVAK